MVFLAAKLWKAYEYQDSVTVPPGHSTGQQDKSGYRGTDDRNREADSKGQLGHDDDFGPDLDISSWNLCRGM